MTLHSFFVNNKGDNSCENLTPFWYAEGANIYFFKHKISFPLLIQILFEKKKRRKEEKRNVSLQTYNIPKPTLVEVTSASIKGVQKDGRW